jgi:hypothetical protein
MEAAMLLRAGPQLRTALNVSRRNHNCAEKLRLSEVLGTFLQSYDRA